MLKSFNIKEAWTFLFKEKQWGVKLLVPMAPAIIFGIVAAALFIPATFIVFPASSARVNSDIFAAAGVLGSLLLLCLCCVAVIFVIVQAIISNWYQYEVTEASLKNRESNLITKENKMDVIKKAGKLFLVNTIYNIPTGIVVGIMYALFFVIGAGTANVRGSGASAVGLIVICCLMLVVILFVVPFNFFIVQTAKVRLIETSTFREAFRIRTIFETVKTNFNRLSLFLGVLIAFVVGYIVISFIFSILGIIPLVNLCLIPFQIALGLLSWFFGIFAYPYMTGKVYKEVK